MNTRIHFPLALILMLALLAPLSLAATNSTLIVSSSDVVVSLVNQDPDPALTGDVVELRVGIENAGQTPLNDLFVEIEPTFPFRLAPGEQAAKSVGTLQSHQVGSDIKIVKYKILIDKEAMEADYPLKLLTYAQGNRDSARVERTIQVSVKSRESAEIVYIDQVELLPGKITPLTFTINNVGAAPLREITFHWENPDGIILPVGSDDTKYVKYLDVGESAKLVYNVIASGSSTPNLYKLDLSLTYQDSLSGGEKTISTIAGVYVGGGTDFDVAFAGSSNGQSSFSISNIGSVAANSVTVRIPRQAGWVVSGSDAVIIGNLNVGDYTIASFNVQAPNQSMAGFGARGGNATPRQQSPAEGEIARNRTPDRGNGSHDGSALKIQIDYTDSRGNRNSVVKSLSMDTSALAGTRGALAAARPGAASQSSLLGTTGWIIIAGLALVCAWAFLRSRRAKGRLKDPDYTYAMAARDLVTPKKPRR